MIIFIGVHVLLLKSYDKTWNGFPIDEKVVKKVYWYELQYLHHGDSKHTRNLSKK